MPLLRDIRDELSSSYLLDHADNPVAWRTWSEDSLEDAVRLDRPIFLSIGYAACHWCHVMAHESFEDANVAAVLNEQFIPIKVDREERPDVDALYMAATQLVSGHGGWPMSVFLLPDGRPFMAGTYYPPVERHGQASFTTLLRAMHDAWTSRRSEVERQADELSRAMAREVSFIDHLAPFTDTLDLAASRERLRDELVERVDVDGGFGDAPKFPRPSYVEALLEFHDETARSAVERTLDAMSRRGIYDHLRGGFARYSVDAEWHVPHFEKMLSDQALLARAYLRAARAMPEHPEWRSVALDTIDFVVSDLAVASGYASALDADAGGVEGSHVTWTPEEVSVALDADARGDVLDAATRRWRIDVPGAFEGRSIPRLSDGEPFVTPNALQGARESLRRARAQRIQPARDEKVILEWNAMFASALFETREARYVERATSLLRSLEQSHYQDDVWWRTDARRAHASASDVAWMLDVCVDAFEATGDDAWTEAATSLARYLLDHYWDGEVPSSHSPHVGNGVFSRSNLVTDLHAQPKEIFDGATPSSHAVACRALARLALCSADDEILVVAQRLVELAASLLAAHPGAVPDLLEAAGFALSGVEVVIPANANALTSFVRGAFTRRAVLITGSGSSPLLKGRVAGSAYVCRAGVCQLPVDSVAALDEQLRIVGA
jgi:uncharacterized protein YyaL (SSP411 family)